MKWSKVSQTNKANYYEATKHNLNNIFLPFEMIKCNDAHCCDQKHLELINKFYSDIVYGLLQPLKDVLRSSCHHISFHPITSWNDSVKLAYIRARTSYLSWVKKGRPKNGEIRTRVKSTQKQFKYELRRCKRLKYQKSADALAKAFHSDTSSKDFWQNIKKLKKSCSLPPAVGGASGSQKLAEMWKNHFSNLFNSVEKDEYKELLVRIII